MGAFFESALLFSLAVLIILIGLLVYYFKGRVVELEQKNAKCLEIINDVYGSHCLLKQTVTAMLMEAADEPQPKTSYINVEIEDELDESSRVSYTDDEDEQIKTVHVNLDMPETFELDDMDIDELANEDEDEDAGDIDDDNNSIDTMDFEPQSDDMLRLDDVSNVQIIKTEEAKPSTDSKPASSVNDYKKMSVVALRGYIISSGIQTDAGKLRRMSKQELIDIINEQTVAE